MSHPKYYLEYIYTKKFIVYWKFKYNGSPLFYLNPNFHWENWALQLDRIPELRRRWRVTETGLQDAKCGRSEADLHSSAQG